MRAGQVLTGAIWQAWLGSAPAGRQLGPALGLVLSWVLPCGHLPSVDAPPRAVTAVFVRNLCGFGLKPTFRLGGLPVRSQPGRREPAWRLWCISFIFKIEVAPLARTSASLSVVPPVAYFGRTKRCALLGLACRPFWVRLGGLAGTCACASTFSA